MVAFVKVVRTKVHGPVAVSALHISNPVSLLELSVHLKVRDVIPIVATRKFEGAAGGKTPPRGLTLLEKTEAGPVPMALVAVTLNLYAVPLFRPVTVMGLAAAVAVIFPGLDVTVYEIIGLPPFDAGGVKLIVA